MNNIFKDHPHNNQVLTKHGKKWVYKSTEDKSVQLKEFNIQKFLQTTGLVPKCREYSNQGFLEEFIDGNSINNHDIEKDYIIKLARACKTIHGIDVTNQINNFLRSSIHLNNTYDPIAVYHLIIGNNRKLLLANNIDTDLLERKLNKLKGRLASLDYRFSIIHGDLSGNNVIVTPTKEIRIIDWTDCRADLGICDVAQFFHLTQLDKELQETFLEEYNSNLGFGLMMQIQKIFFELYDVLHDYHQELELDPKLVKKLNLSLGKLNEY